MHFRPYEPGDEQAWLEFMATVQIKSEAWEALYTEKPSFHSDCDHLLIKDKTILGVIAGHKVDHPEQSVYSIEILASHPQMRAKGIAKSMIFELSQTLPQDTVLTFWTRCQKAKLWYEKNQFPLVDTRHQRKINTPKKVFSAIGNASQEGSKTLWCFACLCQKS